jgi:hypothetical protein
LFQIVGTIEDNELQRNKANRPCGRGARDPAVT